MEGRRKGSQVVVKRATTYLPPHLTSDPGHCVEDCRLRRGFSLWTGGAEWQVISAAQEGSTDIRTAD